MRPISIDIDIHADGGVAAVAGGCKHRRPVTHYIRDGATEGACITIRDGQREYVVIVYPKPQDPGLAISDTHVAGDLVVKRRSRD